MSQLKRMKKEQIKAARAALVALKKHKKALIRSATGTGKSRMILRTIKLIQRELSSKPALILVHRNDLIDQMTTLFKQHNMRVSRFCADEKDLSGQIVIGSVPTLSRKEHLQEIDPDKFGLVVLDEAHHAPADSFHNTLNHFSKALKLGVTATPFRPDKMHEKREHFGEIVYELLFEEAKKLKIVAKEKAFLILTDSVINGVSTVSGDYGKKTLERLYTTKGRNDVIVRSYVKYGRGTMDRKGLTYKSVCFCINTKHAMRMTKIFNASGVKAAFLVSDRRYLSPSEREATLKQFKETNDIEMLCVVDIFNEGIDIPDLCCALMVRPTRSNIIYQQQVGRVCRRVEGEKHDFVILDYVDNTTQEFTCYTADNLFKKKATKANIVTEYLTVKDPVVVRKRIADVMASVRKFEEQFSHRKSSEEWKKYFLSINEKPQVGSKEYAALHALLSKGKRYDPIFKKLLIDKKPDWFQNSLFFEKLMKNAHPDVTLKKGQKWKGRKAKYWFIHSSLGPFEKSCKGIKDSWKRGVSGHPLTQNRGAYNRRKVKNKTTGKIFNSISEAARSCGTSSGNIARALKRKTKCKNYYWIYL